MACLNSYTTQEYDPPTRCLHLPPLKFNVEPKHGDLEDDFPFPRAFFRFHVISRGVYTFLRIFQQTPGGPQPTVYEGIPFMFRGFRMSGVC